MEVILLRDVEKLGLRGEVVNVARGYARNYLVPRRLAEVATPARIAEVRRREDERARHEARSVEHAREIAGVLDETVVEFEVQAGPTGTLFGSVTPSDIADEIWRARKVRVDRRKIGLDEPTKRVGRYSIPIEVFTDVTATVRAVVAPIGGELPPEEAAADGADAGAPTAATAAGASAAGETAVAEEEALAAAHDAPGASEEAEPGVEASGLPDDRFDRAVDSALEAEGEEL